MRLRISPSADTDIREAVFRYGEVSEQRVASFLTRYRDALRRILLHPTTYPVEMKRGGREIRLITIDRFPYSIIYEVQEDEIVVIALWHQHSRGEDWSRRET